MANLFSDPLSVVGLDDIEEFLGFNRPEDQRPSEGVRIDFKKDLPQDLGNDVAAMANTYGGLIFVGVESDKKKHNVPTSALGTEIGTDAKARITDIILSSVHPRPSFEVHPYPRGTRSLVIIRVDEGGFPPYEFNQGSTVKIPRRVQDTNRQATVMEIEDLLNKRNQLGKDAHKRMEAFLAANDPYCTMRTPQGEYRTDHFQRITVIPHLRLSMRLDSKLEKLHSRFIRTAFLLKQGFSQEIRTGSFYQAERRGSNGRQIDEIWRICSDGSLIFVANLRGEIPIPIGGIALNCIFFLRFVQQVFSEKGYFGRGAFSQVLSNPSKKFSSKFPVDEDLWDEARGINFPSSVSALQRDTSNHLDDIDYDDMENPRDLIASVLLVQLREISGAQVDYDALSREILNLEQNFPRKVKS